jgi:uncharacterized protein (TIGR03437 family)
MDRINPQIAGSKGEWPRLQSRIWRSPFFRFVSMSLLVPPNVLLAQVNVLTANYDNSRTNSNVSETVLSPSNVTADSFGKIGSFPVDGQIYAQPLYAAGVPIPGLGTRNVVYTVTMHNSVYAIDADAPASVVPLWQVNLGPSVPSSVLDFTDILPEVGILSTPVIDLGQQVIYIVSDTLEDGVPVFRMHALSLADGHEMFHGPAVIAASVPGTGAGSENGTLPFDASLQLQRPGLALVNGIVYAAFGSHADDGNYHGWMIGYAAGDLRRRVAVFNTTPNTWGASFWQAGRAPAIDNAGNIFAVTGNGDFTEGSDFGDSVLKLSGHDLSLLDWYTPENCSDLNDQDLDLGSAGAILIPTTNQVLTIGKSGDLLLINSDSMGHLGPWNSTTAQSFRVNPANGGAFANVAVWQRRGDAIVYLLEPCGPLKAYQIVASRLDPTMLSQSSPATCTEFTGIAVSAKDDTDGTGIIWQTTGDFAARQIPGTLHAFDAADLSHELWNSGLTPDRDTLGRFAKFVAPTVVNGQVYVPTFSNRLVIYGLLSAIGQANADVQVTAIANSASLLHDAVSPGEVVAIFGAHIGPEKMTDLQVDDTGHAANTVADTQVLFDGVPAPLLYTSSSEIGAVVPFGIAGPTTQMQVLYRGQRSTVSAVSVVPAVPALFALDGTGGGQGAILNADGSVNSWDHPAKRGSIVALFGTGLGQTTPQSEDGRVTDGSTLPTVVLPVTVLIDGQPAEILYAGAAPGMLLGFVQVNVRIPNTVTAEGDLRVALKVGDYASPTIVTLNVR